MYAIRSYYVVLYRGVNDFAEHPMTRRIDRRTLVVRFNNLVSRITSYNVCYTKLLRFELGLIYTIEINDDDEVKIVMTLTAPGCPVAGDMPGWVIEAVEAIPGIKSADVSLTWEPPWGMDMMSDEA